MTFLATTPGDGSLESAAPAKASLAFRAGVGLIVASHAVYPVYGALPFLGLSPAEIAGVAAGSSLASWGVFSLGVALAGKDGVPYLRRVVARALGRGR